MWILCLEDLAYPNGIMIQYLQLVYNLGSLHMGRVIFRKGFKDLGNGTKSAKWSHSGCALIIIYISYSKNKLLNELLKVIGLHKNFQ